MAYAEYNTRKSRGMRYTVDPSLVLDQQRMAEEYAQLPQKRALALSREQLALNDRRQQEQLDLQRERDEQSGKSSMVGTAGNVAGMYLLNGGAKDIYGGVKTGIDYLTNTGMSQTGQAANTWANAGAPGIDYGTTIPAIGEGVTTGIGGATSYGASTAPALYGSLAEEAAANASSGMLTQGSSYVAPTVVDSTAAGLTGTLAAEGGTTLGGIASGVGTGMGYAALGTVGRELGSAAFDKGADTVRGWGGSANEQAANQINTFLAKPLKRSTLEGASQTMWNGIVGKDSPWNLQNSEIGRAISVVLDPVGTILENAGTWVGDIFGW